MAKIKRQRTKRRPSHPGEILKGIWLDEMNYTQIEFAKILSEKTNGLVKESTMRAQLSRLVNGKRAMSADFAVLLSQVLGTSPRMWMNLQTDLDIWEAEERAA